MKSISVPQPPVHVLSAFVTIVLDWLWFMIEIPATGTGVGLIFPCPKI